MKHYTRKRERDGLGGSPRPESGRGLRIVNRLLIASSISLLAGCLEPQNFKLPGLAPPPPPPQPGVEAERQETFKLEKEPLDKESVLMAQQGLTDLGYRPGPVDGVMGPRTRAALRAYQESVGLPPSGRLTTALVTRVAVEGKASVEAQKGDDAKENRKASDPLPEATPPPPRSQAPQKPKTRAASKGGKGHGAELPIYEVGTTYVYSDGRVETVVGLKGDIVRWRRHDGTRFSAHRNFLTGPTYWQSGDERGTKALEPAAARLWPRRSGKPVAYSADIQIQLRNSPADLTRWREDWQCEYDGKERLTVAAGPFDTIRFLCKRDATEVRPRMERVWYYAPAVRHYVRLTEKFSDAEQLRQVELVAIQPDAGSWPAIVRSALSRALVRVLESGDTGTDVSWASSGIDSDISLRATSDLRPVEGRSCRSYLQVWRDREGEKRYPGAACRSAPGRWTIPGLAEDNEGQLAITE